MTFNVGKMFDYAVKEINLFHSLHGDETFYAFAIDSCLLCFNSNEKFNEMLLDNQSDWENENKHLEEWINITEKDLILTPIVEREEIANVLNPDLSGSEKEAWLSKINEYRVIGRERGNPYKNHDEIQEMRGNTGDWAYQEFSELTEESGFDSEAYEEHYDLGAKEQACSEYGLAMDNLIEKLKLSGVFDQFKKDDDFYATRVEHNY